MIFPVRCWSCGKPIGHLWEEFSERKKKGEDMKKIMDSMNVSRYCCRAFFLGHVDLMDDAAVFKKF